LLKLFFNHPLFSSLDIAGHIVDQSETWCGVMTLVEREEDMVRLEGQGRSKGNGTSAFQHVKDGKDLAPAG